MPIAYVQLNVCNTHKSIRATVMEVVYTMPILGGVSERPDRARIAFRLATGQPLSAHILLYAHQVKIP